VAIHHDIVKNPLADPFAVAKVLKLQRIVMSGERDQSGRNAQARASCGTFAKKIVKSAVDG
jgi:hypothetical protein